MRALRDLLRDFLLPRRSPPERPLPPMRRVVTPRFFEVSDELARKLEEASRKDARDRIEDAYDAFLLEHTMAFAAFLTRDGCIVWESEGDMAPTLTNAFVSIVAGAKKTGVRELLELLPPRPDYALTCDACSGTGWRTIPNADDELRFVCETCGGTGWRRDRVDLPVEVSSWIAARIDAFDDEAPEELRWLGKYVGEFRALPLLLDLTMTAGIRPDGALVWWSTESEWDGTRPVDDPLARHQVLAVGSEEHAELAGIAPLRTEDAVACGGCSGTGVIDGSPDAVCLCGGLGWIPRELEGLQPPRPEAHG